MPAEFTLIVSLCSGIAAIVALVKMINTPLWQIKEHDKDIKEIKATLQKRNEVDKAMLNGLTAITNHMIDGNGIESLRQSRNDLQNAINDLATK